MWRKKVTNELKDKIEALSLNMEKSGFRDYVTYISNRKKLFYTNFIAGLARGIGTAIGFTLLAAVVIYIVQWLVRLNLPYIGEFLADLSRLIDFNNKNPSKWQ
jgi:hypothetical protein